MSLTVEEQKKLKASLCANPIGMLDELTHLRSENERLKGEVEAEKMMRHFDKQLLATYKSAVGEALIALERAKRTLPIWDGYKLGDAINTLTALTPEKGGGPPDQNPPL